MIADYPWGRSYETAILETDRSKLAKHIQVAEQAIMTRMQELNSDHGGSEEERAAIRDALSGLRFLQKEITQSGAEENVGGGTGVPTHRKQFGVLRAGAGMNESQEAWETLCKQASTEQDPDRLMNLVRRILELLDGNVGSSTPDQHVQPGESSND